MKKPKRKKKETVRESLERLIRFQGSFFSHLDDVMKIETIIRFLEEKFDEK